MQTLVDTGGGFLLVFAHFPSQTETLFYVVHYIIDHLYFFKLSVRTFACLCIILCKFGKAIYTDMALSSVMTIFLLGDLFVHLYGCLCVRFGSLTL